MLITEEPELFLHPQARRVISAELDKFLKSSKEQPRQLIISTHSTEYLKNVDPYNIIRVYKDAKYNCSIAKQLDAETSSQITLELKRFLWSNNTELFFADKVVLVEGGEVYLIPSIVDKIHKSKQLLDYQNITVTRINGKGSFLTYVKMLQCFDIEFLILGDLDCFKDVVNKLVTHLMLDDIKENVLKIKQNLSDMAVNYTAIGERIKNVDKNYDAQALNILFEKFISGNIEKDNQELISLVNFMRDRYVKGDKEEAILKGVGNEIFAATQKILRENNIFIWSKGELETYYTQMVLERQGQKDLKALEVSYLLQNEEQDINELFVHVEEINELVTLILSNRRENYILVS